MRVGFVVYGDMAATTGGFVYDRRLVEGLRERGESVEIISLPWEDYPRALLDNLSPAIHQRVTAADVDLLLVDEVCHPSLVAANGRVGADVPIVSVVHHLRSSEPHPAPLRALYRAVERAYLGGVDGFVFNSRTTRGSVERLVEPRPSIVAHPAGDRFESTVDEHAIDRRAHESGPLRIVFLGSVERRKGLDTLVEGLARLPRDAWRLTAIGDATKSPGYVRRVRRKIATVGVADRCRLTGRLPDDAVAAELERAHLLAIPSRYEGFGIAYLEGMGFGLPALATTAGGAGEIVDHGETGFLVPPEDPAAVAGAIGPLLGDRDRLGRMGRAALARWRAHPGWEETVERIHRFLAGIVGESGQGRPTTSAVVPEA